MRYSRVAALAVTMILAVGTASAAEWNLNGNGNWNVDGNWVNPGTFPNAVDSVADFSKLNITNHRSIYVEAGITVGSLLLGDTSGNHTYLFYNGTAGILTFDVSAGNATLYSNSVGTDAFYNAIVLNNTLEISGGSLNFIDSNTAISGTGGIIYNGSGTLGMRGGVSGQYSYAGNTVVNSGIYLGSHANNGNLAPGNLQINEAKYQGYYNASLLRPLGTGAGQFQLTGGTAAGFNYNNNLTIRFGNSNSNVAQWGSAVFDPGTLLLGNNRTSGGGSGNFYNILDLNGATRTIDVTLGHAGLEWIMRGEIRDTVGGAALIKTGNGVLQLNTANTFTGGVTINNGAIRTNSATALSSGNVNVEAGATLEIDVANAIGDAAVLTINGGAWGASKLILDANETVGQLWVDGTQLAVGTYDSASGLASGGDPLISGAGTLTVLNGPAPPAQEITIKTNDNIAIADGDNSASIAGTDFGPIDTVAGSKVLTFKITSDGIGDLTLSAQPAVSDTTNYSISAVTGGDLVLASGETQTFNVTFAPASGGAKPATVTVLSDDPDEGTYTFGITGEGLVPQSAVWILDGNGNWDVDSNWNPSVAFGVDQVADFSTINITNHRNVNIETDITVGSLLLGDTSGAHTYRFYNGTAGILTFDVSAGNATLANNSGGTDSFNNAIVLNDTLEISGGSVDFVNNDTMISGTGGIIYNGTGTLNMRGGVSGQYSYTGATVVNSGIYLGSSSFNGNLPAGNVQINGALYQGYYNASLTRPLGTGAGQFQLTGGTAAGFYYNNSLTIRFGNNNNNVAQWGSAVFDPGTLLLGNNRTSGGGDGNFYNILDLNGAARTIDVTLGHAGLEWYMRSEIRDTVGGASLIKTGNGALNLMAANTYSGETIVNGGTLRVRDSSNLSDTAALRIATGAIVEINGGVNDTVNTLYLNGVIAAAGTWGSSASAAANVDDTYFSGTGILTVLLSVSPATVVRIR